MNRTTVTETDEVHFFIEKEIVSYDTAGIKESSLVFQALIIRCKDSSIHIEFPTDADILEHLSMRLQPLYRNRDESLMTYKEG